MLATATAPAIIRSGILMPIRNVVMPTVEEEIAVLGGGNTLLTIEMITREALRILNKQMVFAASTNRAFDVAFGDTIRIRAPMAYGRR